MAKRRTHEDFVEEMNNINSNIEITGRYINTNTKVDCKCKICSHEWSPRASHLLEGYGCPNCNNIRKIKTHEDFINEISLVNPDIEILGEYINSNVKIKCKCKICGYIWDALPSNLLKGRKCKICSVKQKAKSLSLSQKEFITRIKKINKNIDIIGEYINSDTKVLCKCILCDSEFYIRPDCVQANNRISCPVCSDGISYPNKYIRNFLKQLPIENLEYEWKLKDYKQYSYDNYFIYNNTEYIVEADGAQHYQENKFGKWKPDEVQERDRIKDELATNHNIKMIRIDCQKSEANYIKEKILCSELSSIFDLSNIDWDLCNREALNSLVKKVCDLYKDGYRNIDIVNELQLDRHTVTKYLKIGSELGWCKYINKFKKEIYVYDKDTMEKKYEFDSMNKCTSFLSNLYNENYSSQMIASVCGGYKKSYKGFVFKYAS